MRTDAASKEELQLSTFSSDNCIENMTSNLLPTMRFSLVGDCRKWLCQLVIRQFFL